MGEFLVMIGEIFIIICIQSFLEVLSSGKKATYMQKVVMIACYLGSMYIVLHFAVNYLFREIGSAFSRFF